MEQRQWLTFVKPAIQLKFLSILVATVLVNLLVLAGFTWYVIDLLIRRSSVDPAVLEGVFAEVIFYGSISGLAALGITALLVYVYFREFNRVVGPIYRVKEELGTIHRTGSVKPISVRSGDHFQDMVKQLNLVLLDLSQNDAG